MAAIRLRAGGRSLVRAQQQAGAMPLPPRSCVRLDKHSLRCKRLPTSLSLPLPGYTRPCKSGTGPRHLPTPTRRRPRTRSGRLWRWALTVLRPSARSRWGFSLLACSRQKPTGGAVRRAAAVGGGAAGAGVHVAGALPHAGSTPATRRVCQGRRLCLARSWEGSGVWRASHREWWLRIRPAGRPTSSPAPASGVAQRASNAHLSAPAVAPPAAAAACVAAGDGW